MFLQGGASHQFAMAPMNLASDGKPVEVVNTGSWTKKAIGELKKGYNHTVVASSEADNFLKLPAVSSDLFSADAAYAYMCSNNTIFGTQFKSFPTGLNIPLVVDMSSDILSRELTISDFGLIFAGAQKNIGPSGVTLVIIRNDLLDRSPDTIPNFFNQTPITMQIHCITRPQPSAFILLVWYLNDYWIKVAWQHKKRGMLKKQLFCMRPLIQVIFCIAQCQKVIARQ